MCVMSPNFILWDSSLVSLLSVEHIGGSVKGEEEYLTGGWGLAGTFWGEIGIAGISVGEVTDCGLIDACQSRNCYHMPGYV